MSIHWPSFLKDMYRRFNEDQITAVAAQLAYFLILAVFPFLIFLLALLAFIPLTTGLAINDFVRLFPATASDIVLKTMLEVTATRSHTLLSLGMLVTLWAASTGINAIIRGINRAYEEKETRPFWLLIGISLLSTILLALVIVFALLMLVFGQIIGEDVFSFLGLSALFTPIWQWIRWVIPLTTMLLVFLLLYRFTPNRRLSFREIVPGAIFATAGWAMSSMGFSYYVNNFARYAQIYGSIGGIIVLLVWLYISSIVILLGGEINASLASVRKLR